MTAQRAALQITGKSGTFSMEPASDPVQVGRLAHRLLVDPANWKRSTKTGTRADKVVFAVRQRLPQALDLFAPHLLVAVATGAAGGLCSWDTARALAALAAATAPPGDEAEIELEPRNTEPVRALLGPPCAKCRTRQAIAQARRKAEAQAEAGVAARAAIAMIEREDGRLAGKVARWSLERGWSKEMTRRALAAAARPVAVPGISAPAVRPVRPAAAPHRPAAGLRARVPDPAYIRRGRRP